MSERRPAVGVLGGSFDPLHLGHLAVADEVRLRLGLPRVLLTPTARPPHKPPGELSAAHHRSEMVRLAVEGRRGLELCTLELREDRVCYTIDTLRALRGGDPPVDPLFVLGMDSLLQLHTWRERERLQAEFDLVVVERIGEPAHAGDRLDRETAARIVKLDSPADADEPGRGGRVFLLSMAPIPISSSQVRACAARGENLAGLVPAAVAAYIERSGLYRQEDAH